MSSGTGNSPQELGALTWAGVMSNEKPDFSDVELDFSEFHPLDHPPGGNRCRSLPGGLRNHLALTWTYWWAPWLAAKTFCKVGRHRWGQGWTRESDEPFSVCLNCDKGLAGDGPGGAPGP